jgi:hypothetical protein
MTQTNAIDLINPEVLQDAVSAKLPKAIKFAPYAKVDDTLVGMGGDTITRPKYAYVGAAEDLVEGTPMTPAKMSMSTTQVTVKEAGKSIELTEKAILTNVDGTVANAEDQIVKALADKVDIDYLATLGTTLLSFNGTATSSSNILDAIDVFGDENDENYILFINPKDYTKLLKSFNSPTALSREQVAELVGVKEIVKTNRVAVGTSFIQKEGAVEIVYKKQPSIKVDEDILARTVVLAGNQYYTTNLFDDSGVVKLAATV